MIFTAGSAALLLAAGVMAGIVGTAGGITSLVSYPALLAVGVPALPANVASLIAGVACWPGSLLVSQRELTGSRRFLTRGLPVAAVGAGAGSGLLLTTPPGVFARVVPWLVVAGSVALLAQPWLTARRARRAHPTAGWTLLGVGTVSIYGGYFGAGSGVMMLALLLVLVDARFPSANASKNMLIGAGGAASAVLLIVAGPVDWRAVTPLAIGLFAGSLIGPRVASRVPASVVRWAVAGLGLVLAVRLWLEPH